MTGAEIGEILKQFTALLMAISAIVTPCLAAWVIKQNAQTKAHVVQAVAAVDAKVETAVAVVSAVDAKVESAVVTVAKIDSRVDGLGKQIDGQQEKLMAAVSDAAVAKGRADVAKEQAHDQAIIDSVKAEVQKVNGTPQPVEIVQPSDKPVPVGVTKER